MSTEIQYLRAVELLDEFFVQVYFVSRGANKKQDDEGAGSARVSGLHDRTKSMTRSMAGRLLNRKTTLTELGNSANLASVMVCLQTVSQLKTLHEEFLSTLEDRVALEKERVEKMAGEDSVDGGEESAEVKAKAMKKSVNGFTDALCVGDLFERFGSLFRLYSQYQNNYDVLIDAIGTDPSLSATMTNFRMTLFAQGYPLKDAAGRDAALGHLVKPMERMLQYDTLLTRLLERTEDTHPDHESLTKAVTQIHAAQAHIRHTMWERDNKDIILEIEEAFVDKNRLLVRGRRFVRQGPLVKVCRREDKKFFFWLFTDLLVYGHAVGGGRYKFHRSMDIAHVRVSNPDVHQGTESPCFTIASENKSFVVYLQGEPDESSFRAPREPTPSVGEAHDDGIGVLTGAVEEDPVPKTRYELRDAWFRDVYELTNAYLLQSGSQAGETGESKTRSVSVFAPVWQTDKSSRGCQLCGIGFTLTRRRHHCRVCGRLVCNACSPHRLVVTGSSKKARVCNACEPEQRGKNGDEGSNI